MKKHDEKNGAATVKNADNANAAAAPSAANSQPQATATAPKEEVKPETLETKLEKQRERGETLRSLFDHQNKLLESKLQLRDFKVSADESSHSLLLEDGKGAKFRTCRPMVIAEVLDLVRKNIDAKLEEVQTAILAA